MRIRIRIDGNCHLVQIVKRVIAVIGVDASTAHRRLESVRYLQPPDGGDNRPPTRHLIEHSFRSSRARILEIPRDSQRGIDHHQAHLRPWSINSRIEIPPRVTPFRRSRIAATARRARSRSKPSTAGTSFATARPRRVIPSNEHGSLAFPRPIPYVTPSVPTRAESSTPCPKGLPAPPHGYPQHRDHRAR
jgi:hypothetical protein